MNWRKAFTVFLILSITMIPLFSGGQQDAGGKKKVTLKMSDNIPDRVNTWGAVIEKINADFIELNPNVEIETESYQDQPYQEKIKIYATAGQLPDVMRFWSFSTLMLPLVESNMLEPLDYEMFKDMNWMPGSLESNMVDGKLYGIPISGDLWVIYYNEAILKECGVAMPKTMTELAEAAKKISAKGYIPMVTDGKDGWPLSITFDNIFWRVNGDYSLMKDALAGKKPFTDPEFVEAAKAYQEFFKNSGAFTEDLVTMDYGTARNLFGQQQAAMFLMGSWELGLATDTNFSTEFQSSLRVAKFPTFGSKGSENDLVAWFGGNYIISADSDHKELAKEYLQLYARTYPKRVWEQQVAFPAQAVEPRESDTTVAKNLLAIAAAAEATSGAAGLDQLTPEFKEVHQKSCIELAVGLITPEQFCAALNAAAIKANK
jgi:raffinose/stachyose/melibiose transport system substrate-binding protein